LNSPIRIEEDIARFYRPAQQSEAVRKPKRERNPNNRFLLRGRRPRRSHSRECPRERGRPSAIERIQFPLFVRFRGRGNPTICAISRCHKFDNLSISVSIGNVRRTLRERDEFHNHERPIHRAPI
jgi:hypothetical protein